MWDYKGMKNYKAYGLTLNPKGFYIVDRSGRCPKVRGYLFCISCFSKRAKYRSSTGNPDYTSRFSSYKFSKEEDCKVCLGTREMAIPFGELELGF